MTTNKPPSRKPRLARRLGLRGAIFIGLGSMIGAGVFSAFAPAAQAAGSWLLVGLAIAGLVAVANATSSAQLAIEFPTSGGTYVYGREVLGAWWGFVAGWSFVIGKLASAAAIALVFAAYVVPEAWQRPVAVVAILVITSVNLRGISRTARMAVVIVVPVLVVLVVVIVAGLIAQPAGFDVGQQFFMTRPNETATLPFYFGEVYGVLQSAGLLFFAFAGYARIATLGEEVTQPERTIPRAIAWSLVAVFVIYLGMGAALLNAMGPAKLANSSHPAVDVMHLVGWDWAIPAVAVGAALATLGALLALIAGIGRTTFAMAREGDLPRILDAVHPRYQVPHRAEMTVGLIVIALVLVVDLRGAIGFSSFGVLVYYFVANVAALRQPPEQRRYPRALQVTGAVACVVLVATLPWTSVLLGLGVVMLGVAYRATTKNSRSLTR